MHPSPSRRFFVGLIFGIQLIGACSYKHATLFPPAASAKKPIRNAYVILLLFDGARPEDLNLLLARGELPNIKRLFFESGARFEHALTVIPTCSTPAHQSFISGLYPGHHGIPNLDWFSRPLGKQIDYLSPLEVSLTNTYMFNFKQLEEGQILTDQAQLIYQDLKGYPTLAVFETANSGASKIFPKHPPVLTAFHGKIEKFYEAFDLAAMRSTLDNFRKLPSTELPRFSFVSLYGMDLVTHFDGLMGNRVQDLYRLYDRFLGELEAILKQRGIWEQSTLVVVSDHGQHELQGSSDLKKILSRVGLQIGSSPSEAENVKYSNHGLSIASLYLKIGKDWLERPSYQDLQHYPLNANSSVNLIERFLQEPDIEFVIAPEGPWRIHLHRKEQHALIERKVENGRTLYSYVPDPGDDPLEYLQWPEIKTWVEQREFVDETRWLKATAALKFPDAVVQLAQFFADYRGGDLILMTNKESQFKEKRLAGHGSIYSEDMQIVMMLQGPNILPGIYQEARSVDLYPTLLALYGLKPSGPTDGVLRQEIFKDGSNPNWEDPAYLAEHKNPEATASFFEKQLREKLSQGKLSTEEKEKAEQLLYTMEQFEREQHDFVQHGTVSDKTGIAQKLKIEK